MNKKTVYIVGAGFSMDFGAPSQSEIVKEIFKLKESYSILNKRVHKWVDLFDDFLINSLHLEEHCKEHYSLEDVYTPIDKCISEGVSFREFSVNDLIKIRDIFNKLITLAVRNAISRENKK